MQTIMIPKETNSNSVYACLCCKVIFHQVYVQNHIIFIRKILFSKNLFFRYYIKRSNFLINPINTRLIIQFIIAVMYDLNNNATNKPAYALSRHSANVKIIKYKLITNLILSNINHRSQPNNATDIGFNSIYKIN